MTRLIISAFLVCMLTGCLKNEFDKYEVHEDPYETRMPIQFDQIDIYFNGGPWVAAAWRIDTGYLNEYHPGYVVEFYTGSYYVTEITGSQGSFDLSVPFWAASANTTVYVRILVEDEIRFENEYSFI